MWWWTRMVRQPFSLNFGYGSPTHHYTILGHKFHLSLNFGYGSLTHHLHYSRSQIYLTCKQISSSSTILKYLWIVNDNIDNIDNIVLLKKKIFWEISKFSLFSHIKTICNTCIILSIFAKEKESFNQTKLYLYLVQRRLLIYQMTHNISDATVLT